jgi:hypothetical protein
MMIDDVSPDSPGSFRTNLQASNYQEALLSLPRLCGARTVFSNLALQHTFLANSTHQSPLQEICKALQPAHSMPAVQERRAGQALPCPAYRLLETHKGSRRFHSRVEHSACHEASAAQPCTISEHCIRTLDSC